MSLKNTPLTYFIMYRTVCICNRGKTVVCCTSCTKTFSNSRVKMECKVRVQATFHFQRVTCDPPLREVTCY